MIDRQDAEFILKAIMDSQMFILESYMAETNMVHKKILADIMDKNSRAIDFARKELKGEQK